MNLVMLSISKVINWGESSEDYLKYRIRYNVKVLSVLSFTMSFICLILWIDNEIPVVPLKLEYSLNYYNISAAFFIIFFINWLVLIQARKSNKMIKLALYLIVLCAFAFMDLITYLEIGRESGLTAITLGYMTLAVLFSSRPTVLGTLFLLNGIFFYYFASLNNAIEIENFRMSIAFIIVLSITAFLMSENQRRKIFASKQQLERKIKELNSALDLKSIFYGHIVHELRTPLNAIIGFSEMLKRDTYQPKSFDKVREYSGFIHSSGLHLLSIVNEILNSAKIEAGEVDVKVEKTNLSKILRRHINELGSISKDKNQLVTLNMHDEDLNINTDRRLLKQIIFNLLSNAQKYTPRGGHIEISASSLNPHKVEISIKDNGKGMDKELIKELNNPDRSSGTHFITQAEGTGFGLIIVGQLIQLLGGSIFFNSVLGQGTYVKITLPQ